MAFRWIINHLVGLFVLGAVIFVVIYRHEVGARVSNFAEATGYGFVVAWLTPAPTPKAAPRHPPEPKPAPENAPKPEPAVTIGAEPETPKAVPQSEPGSAPAPILDSAAPEAAPQAAKEPARKVAEKPAPAPALAAQQQPQDQPAPRFAAPETAAPQQTTAATPSIEATRPTAALNADSGVGPCIAAGDKPTAAVIRAWAAARAHYWRGDLAGAVAAYEQLVQDHPDLADLPGELANIHFGQGRVDKAAGLYLETGLRLIKSDALGCAQRVVAILRPIDPEKADYLNGRINANPREQGAR